MMPLALLLPILVAAQAAPVPTTFRYVGPDANEVSLVGEMNGAQPSATPMTRGEGGTSALHLRTVDVATLLPERPIPGAPIGTVRREPLAAALTGPGGLLLPRTCARGTCVDGLVDTTTGHVLVSKKPTPDEKETLGGPGGWLERAVRVTSVGERTVSAYVGSVWWSDGAAHRNAHLGCATWDRKTGRRLALSDVIPAGEAKTLLRELSMLTAKPDEAIERLGDTLVPDCTGCAASASGLLLEPGPEGPEAVLCLEVPVPGAGMGVVHELRVGALRRALVRQSAAPEPWGTAKKPDARPR